MTNITVSQWNGLLRRRDDEYANAAAPLLRPAPGEIDYSEFGGPLDWSREPLR